VRKFAALFSIVLILSAVNCFNTCLVAQMTPMPPCHQQHDSHPGQLAISAHLDFVLPVLEAPLFHLTVAPQVAIVAAPPVPAQVRPPLIALRI
jgi:hypothetical protein